MKKVSFAIVLVFGGLLIFVLTDFPKWGDPESPASTHLSPYFLEHALEDTAVPNIVTAVLADYRSYDTMFEVVVVFTAAMACFFLLRVLVCYNLREEKLYRHLESGVIIRITGSQTLSATSSFLRVESPRARFDVVTSKVARLLIPFLQIYALYVVAHGHHSPGGGFQGGVTLGAAYILYAISHDLQTACDRYLERHMFILLVGGVLLYAGTGAVCMALGGNFLDYSVLAPLFRLPVAETRSFSILIVEIGVAMTVMATMVLLYNFLVSNGRCEEGL
ncbi:sodium:proton antiporter [Oceanidesulfovibrio indonesiensis]|uniref:Sodium:proton antiporter n=1 Tax=Oceanidesulfovibrio indonesiensis TaxID=54767 RepID=A0A7M3MGM1_9BACT|nr:hydrogen gas-evolving membrane-bound hydrogenase subunit E [Oceanidesulfovibrio indonesiensis]TVM18458.1 sodium:proton antiporter [Oceanidesulfovibrio indonesiensis]